jgi:hypothetical protein
MLCRRASVVGLSGQFVRFAPGARGQSPGDVAPPVPAVDGGHRARNSGQRWTTHFDGTPCSSRAHSPVSTVVSYQGGHS